MARRVSGCYYVGEGVQNARVSGPESSVRQKATAGPQVSGSSIQETSVDEATHHHLEKRMTRREAEEPKIPFNAPLVWQVSRSERGRR